MIDTHCHIDLYENPLQIAQESERLGIITIGVTNLPSHFEMGYPHLMKFKKVRLALGMHPLYASEHKKELKLFVKNISRTSYIGEIGLDFSKKGIATKEIQLESFKMILNELKGKKKLLSIHSRKAEKEVLQLLIESDTENAIFHWYSGPIQLIDIIVEKGYYFSVNPAMILSKSGLEIIRHIPKQNILTESDGPFIEIDNRKIEPKDISLVLVYLANLWNVSTEDVERIVYNNFKAIILKLK
jgi:TatD DNase family protein